jgi:hypothetical protein
MDSTSIVAVITICTTFLGLTLRYAFQSKCDTVNLCWGCMKIHREVEREGMDIEVQSSPTAPLTPTITNCLDKNNVLMNNKV